MNEQKTDPGSIRLFYFTGKQWGLKALWEKRLKVSQYADVNDPFELAPFDLSSKRSRRLWEAQVKRVLQSGHGILCFSEDWRSTLMWSHYGEKHTGLCLGFDVAREFVQPIEYIDKLLPDPIDYKKRLRGLSTEVLEAALRHKHSGWSYEREGRLRVRLADSNDGLFFKKFDDDMHLREVIIGPRCSLTTADVAEAVVNPPLDVDIMKARASFGSFDVCQQKMVSTHTTKGFRAALALARDVYHHELPDDEDGAS